MLPAQRACAFNCWRCSRQVMVSSKQPFAACVLLLLPVMVVAAALVVTPDEVLLLVLVLVLAVVQVLVGATGSLDKRPLQP